MKDEQRIDYDDKIANKATITKNSTKKYTNEASELIIYMNQKKAIVHWEKNETVPALLEVLPANFQMEDLYGNEKYLRLSRPIPSNEVFVHQIKTGDVMLYGNDTLVIFYKDFSTPYAYTKIGHIEAIKKMSLMEGVLQVHVQR